MLQTRGVVDAQRLRDEYDGGKTSFTKDDFKSSIYGHKEVREILEEAQHSKCCFCEQDLLHCARDVEHFRPKSGFQQIDKEKLKKPGYYWLAYEWSNLLLACDFCNRRYKKNYFPLANPAQRAKNHHESIQNEEPLIINPATDDPGEFIAFQGIRAVAIDGNNRGKETILRVGLNDRELLSRRRDKFELVKTLRQAIQTFEKIKPRSEAKRLLAEKALSLEKMKSLYERHFEASAEFSAMLGAARECDFAYD